MRHSRRQKHRLYQNCVHEFGDNKMVRCTVFFGQYCDIPYLVRTVIDP